MTLKIMRLYLFVKRAFIKLRLFVKPFFSFLLNFILNRKEIAVYDIPIIINNRNRLSCLKKLISFLEKSGYRNIYIIDNASTYKPLLEYYKKEYPYQLFALKENVGHLSLWETGLIKRFRNNYFVYTDPDVIPIEECPANFMSIFISVLNKYRLVEKVGFSLQIDDLPDCFDKKADVVAWEKQFWSNVIEGEPKLYKACIDTTFALYRPWTFSGGNLNSPNIRVGFPYVARHLPWYNDSNNLDEEEKYYLNTCKTASYWVGNSKR